MDDEGTFIARVVQAGDHWHAHLTTGEQVGDAHATATAAMVAVDDHLYRRGVRQPAPSNGEIDINQEIRTLRAVARTASCRYQQLLYMGLGPHPQVGTAIRRLEAAGYVSGDDRAIRVTAAGREALRRLDDPAVKHAVQAALFYGPNAP